MRVRDEGTSVKVSVKGTGKVRVTVNVAKQKPVRQPLKFGQGNSKLPDCVTTFSLPAGWFCPFADQCKSKADPKTGRITDGKKTVYRCFSASNEVRQSVRDARWQNAEALLACKSTQEMVDLILDSLSPFAGFVRLHVSGDFFSEAYFLAWVEVARRRPQTIFYGYTKSLIWLVRHKDRFPPNLRLVASYGGKDDRLIAEHGLRFARVVFSEQEAEQLGLEIDTDDSHAMTDGPSFALLLHGSQPAGTAAAKAISALRQIGEYGHGSRADEIRRQFGRIPLATLA